MRTSFIVLLIAFLFVGAIFAAEGTAKQATGAKAADATKPVDIKTGGAKVEVEAAKPVDTKPVDKPVDTKPVETKPVETKPQQQPPAAEAPKTETKPEAAKPAAEPKKEAVKPEAVPKIEEVKPQAAPKHETVAEQAKPVEPKVEPKVETKVEEVKVETHAAEPVKTETKPAAEPVKTETKPAAEPAKTETKPAAEPAKTETKPAAKPKEAEKPAETKSETKPATETKKTAEKKTEKTETKEKTKKATKTEPSTGGSALDDIQKVALEYLGKAQVLAEKYLAEARVYYVKYSQIAQDNAEKLVDKYLSAQNAKLLKTNFFNFYGVLAVTLAFFILAFISSKIDWVFSLNPVRAFLSAFGLGVFFTLYGFTRLVKDPAPLVAKSAPESIENLQIVALGWFAVLVALNFVSVLRGGFRNLLQFLTSSLLFVEYFELKHHIEEHTGSLPPYSLILLAFMILSYLSFAQLEAITNPAVVYNVDYKVKSSSSPSHEVTTVKEKKTKSSKKN